MGKRILFGAVVLLALAILGVFLDPTHTVLGWLRGESYYHGRPTSYWHKALLDKAPSARTNTMKELTDGKADAVPVLRQLLRESGDDTHIAELRWTAADALGQIGPAASPAAGDLAAALKDKNPFVRQIAAAALGKIGPDAKDAVPALVGMLGTEDRLHAVKALTRFKAAAKDAVPALIPVLQDPSPEVRWNTCEALGDMGPAAKDAVPAIAELLKDKEDKVREHAAEALGEIGPDAKAAVPALRELLHDPDKEVRDEAATNSYAACYGDPGPILETPGTGMFYRNSQVSFRSITDGTSSTLAIGERAAFFTQTPWAGTMSGGSCVTTPNAPVYQSIIESAPTMTMARVSGRKPLNDPWSEPYDFFSGHGLVVNFVFADASVHGLSSAADPATVYALATIAGEEVANGVDY